MVALAAAYTFGASLDRAVTTPRLFGQRWDTSIDAQFDALFPDRLGYKTDPSFEAVAAGVYGSATIQVGGRPVVPVGIDELKGSAFPTLLEGKRPRNDHEIVLGTSTLRSIHGRVGASVVVSIPGRERTRMRIVGRAVLPAFGIGAFTPTGLGDGAILTADGLGRAFIPPDAYSFVLIRYAKHPSPSVVRRVNRACDEITLAGELCLVHDDQRTPEISSYGQVRNVSWILAGLLAALTGATLAHGLGATVRRRRRDLAILKTLGFVRRQISAAVAWQATTLVLLALIGIPLGIAAGRWAWTGLADQLGIPAEPRVPLFIVGLTIPALVLLGNLVAALPARAASRTRAAIVLRTE
jgi:putative ABC transport system permease protein